MDKSFNCVLKRGTFMGASRTGQIPGRAVTKGLQPALKLQLGATAKSLCRVPQGLPLQDVFSKPKVVQRRAVHAGSSAFSGKGSNLRLSRRTRRTFKHVTHWGPCACFHSPMLALASSSSFLSTVIAISVHQVPNL